MQKMRKKTTTAGIGILLILACSFASWQYIPTKTKKKSQKLSTKQYKTRIGPVALISSQNLNLQALEPLSSDEDVKVLFTIDLLEQVLHNPPSYFSEIKNDRQIRIAYTPFAGNSLTPEQIASLHLYFDALVVSTASLQTAYQNLRVQIPIFVFSLDFPQNEMATHEIFSTIAQPKRVLLSNTDEIHAEYITTTSLELYNKYLSLGLIKHPPLQECPSLAPTDLIHFLRPIQLENTSSGLKGIDCIYVINLDERPNRWDYTKQVFSEQKLTPNRVSAVNGWKIPTDRILSLLDGDASPLMNAGKLMKGAIGCLLSHVSVYKHALEQGFTTVWICEDDLVFKQKAKKLSVLVNKLTTLDPDWDILYTDHFGQKPYTQKHRSTQLPYQEISYPLGKDFLRIHGRLNTHSILFSKKGLAKVYDYFTHVHLWAPIDLDIHNVPNLREYSVKKDVVTSINDSSVLALDDSSDTQMISSLNE